MYHECFISALCVYHTSAMDPNYGPEYTHFVPEGYRLMVVAFADSTDAVCTEHPTPCSVTWCKSYWLNYAIIKVTGSNFTHCELYWPHTQVSTSVDNARNVHQNKSRTYITAIGRWVFLSLLITEMQERLMNEYIEAQMNKPYDTTSFYLFGLLAATSCIQPRVRPAHHSMWLPDVRSRSLREHLPPSETCARLLMGALIYADVVPRRDVRLATPSSVFRTLMQVGAQPSYELPRTPHEEHSMYFPSAYETAAERHAHNASQAQRLGYALSGGLVQAERPPSVIQLTHGGSYVSFEHPSDADYWRQCGVERMESRFMPAPYS